MTKQNLRERAEQLLQTNPATKPEMNTADVQELVHELQLHQTELEMQNEELQEAYRQLGESRDAYAELYDFAPVGYLTIDQNDMITEVNHTAASMLETERGNLYGCRFRQFVHPDIQTQWLQHRRALKSSGEKQVIELELQTNAGTSVTTRLDCRPAKASDTGNWRCLIALSDITERKRAELDLQKALDDLREAEQQLVEQERRQALTTMASGIAHDFNNALNPIQAFAEMLIDKPKILDDRERTLRYLKHIHKSASHAAATVRRMRKFFRPDEEETFADIDLNAVIRDAVSITQPRWKEEASANGKDIDVKAELGDLPPVRGSEAALNEVLTNLIFNAVDAMPKGGVIRIATKQDRGSVVLEVSDNGVGMREKTKKKCLDAFYTTKGPGGSGLGLATIKGIIQRHDGDMTLESTEGQGTTFRFILPPAQSRPEGENQNESRQNRTMQILVAEDDEIQREMLYDLLSDEGYGVDAAADGADALEYLKAGTYDLIVTDRAMPGMRGDELAKHVKEQVPGKPVIMVTGFGETMDAAGGKPKGVDALVSKPFTRESLQKAIAQVME